MATLISKPQKSIIKLIAKEFLEDRLGIEANKDNIQRLASHLIQFEKEIKISKRFIVTEENIRN